MTAENISGVILAGGENRRFKGRFKPDLRIGDSTIFNRTIKTIREIFVEIIIVTNKPERFSGLKECKITGDIYLNAGPLGGIHSAMKSSSCKAVFVFAGDMPFLDRVLITNQINEYNKKECDALVPEINNYREPLHSIYNNSLVEDLENFIKVGPVHAVKDFLNEINTCYFPLPVNDLTLRSFKNINSPSDLSDIK